MPNVFRNLQPKDTLMARCTGGSKLEVRKIGKPNVLLYEQVQLEAPHTIISLRNEFPVVQSAAV